MKTPLSGSTRRGFLEGAALIGAGIAILPAARSRGASAPAGDHDAATADASAAKTAVAAPSDDDIAARVAALRELSRDARGQFHVERAAFIEHDDVARGTLALSPPEVSALRSALAGGDLTPFHQGGLRLGGEKFVLAQVHDDGTVLHLVRPGTFATVRAAPDVVVVATSGEDMARGRAVEAVYQLLARTTVATGYPVS